MAYTATEIRAVRLLIPDAEEAHGPGQDEYMFDDADIEIYLDQGHGNAKWAAGLASLAVGASEALILKVVRNYETESDGSKLMREWTAKGKALIEEGRLEIDDESSGIFIVAFPEWDSLRHPEGYTHGSYPLGPGSFQW